MIVRKSMYSVRLTDDLMTEFIDRARAMGMDHYDLLDKILCDYLSASTAATYAEKIFGLIAADLEQHGVSAYAPSSGGALYVKRALQYAYRPELKYSIEMGGGGQQAGTFRAVLRTDRLDILDRFNRFTRLWASLEEHYVQKYFTPAVIEYAFESGRFVRPLMIPPGKPPSMDELGRAVGAYVVVFDELLRRYLTHMDVGDSQVEKLYGEYLDGATPV